MLTGTYIGVDPQLKGKTAILQPAHFNAQFDDNTLPRRLTHGWTQFNRDDFEVKSHSVLGLKVVDGQVSVKDLAEWLGSREASAGEYLATALDTFIETGEDVDDVAS